MMKNVAIVAGALVAFLGLIWLLQGNDFFLYKVFAPKYEQVRRETFEQTKSYNQGMVQELENFQAQYVTADAAGKKALAPIILHRAADYPEDKLPQHLREFIQNLRQARDMAK